MAGSKDPPKKQRGRPLGAVDKSRDYRVAVANLRALIASGASIRSAAGTVSKETGIPVSTLRRHLKNTPKGGPVFKIHQAISELSLPAEVNTPEQAEEARRRYYESQREKKVPPPKTASERQIELLRMLDPALRGSFSKKKRK